MSGRAVGAMVFPVVAAITHDEETGSPIVIDKPGGIDA